MRYSYTFWHTTTTRKKNHTTLYLSSTVGLVFTLVAGTSIKTIFFSVFYDMFENIKRSFSFNLLQQHRLLSLLKAKFITLIYFGVFIRLQVQCLKGQPTNPCYASCLFLFTSVVFRHPIVPFAGHSQFCKLIGLLWKSNFPK